jgi:two-component system sensor histidine kinase/response regulator
MKRLLAKRGFESVRARTGQEAVELSALEEFVLVLMDVHMPVLGGLEATMKIRERENATGGHLRIVALTANAMDGDEAVCLAAGVDRYVAKPMEPSALDRALEECRGDGSSRDARGTTRRVTSMAHGPTLGD